MKKSLIILLIVTGLASCNQNKRFHVSGTVKDAAGEMLYIEHTGLQKTDLLDSTKLSDNGEFSFKSARPTYPDFYSLRLNDKIITFAVDSCEKINIVAKAENFATNYVITGSEASKQIQQLRKSVMDIQRKANELTSDLSVDEQNVRISEIEKDIEVHKKMAGMLILQNPRSTAAYFAIFQKVNNAYIFSPYNKSDKPYCAAVATSYNSFMPEYERSKNLYNLVMDAIIIERKAKQKETWDKILATKGKGYIDISLPDKNKVERKLSEFEGKVILIDFSAYESDGSVDYTFALRELYKKYHSRGFEIFQISLDRNKQLWEKSVANIPWVCVRDENGPNTTVIASYNISSIPTTFLMNKQGNIIARSISFKNLSKEIEKCL
jgi:peroxiredoxin